MLLLTSLTMSSCSDLDEYFETPDWISGSIYEELQNDGNYSIFLQGVDKAGYTTIMNGKSILTVMVPDDEAMTAYLQENYGAGATIESLSEDEVKKLIGFHILYYSFDKNKLINFRPEEGDGATTEEQNMNAGLYYKFRTRSQDGITYKNPATRDTAIYHYERLMPVFSYRMFQTKGIDAKSNYEYFYPETGWGDDAGFNVANAKVTEYANIAKNGYIYKVDRVLKPLETIYQEMKSAGNFTRFLSLYDKNEYYEADEDLTLESGNGTTLYHHYHRSPLANIDCEWPVTDYREVSQMALTSYSVFAPTDQAWTDFFNDYWGAGGYESIDEVDSTQVQAILLNSVCTQSIAFPEEIENGTILNSSNEVITFNTDEVAQDNRIICSNGVLYACNVLTPPAKFYSVTGPAYQYKDYSNFLYMLDNSGMMNTLTSTAVDYIMIYPDNAQLEANAGIKMEGSTLISAASPNGMNSSSMTAYIYGHVVTPTDGSTQLPSSGIKVYRTLSPDVTLYWYLKNGRITNSIKHNELIKYTGNIVGEDSVYTTFEPLSYKGDPNGWNNGNAYKYDRLLFEGNYSNVNDSRFVRFMWNLRSDTGTDFYAWINLLDKAGAINRSSYEVNFMTETSLMFVPVTNAVEQAVINGQIPGIKVIDGSAPTVGMDGFFDYCEVTDAEALLDYVKLYFIPMSTATISNYPYLGWGEDTASGGGLITFNQELVDSQIESINVNVVDEGSKLTVGVINPATGNVDKYVDVLGDYDYLPFVYDDGGVQFINDVLQAY